MRAFSRFLIGFGFIWMTLWAILGSLLGAKINASLLSEDTTWLGSVQRDLFRTAHAHMNSMASVVVLLGLTAISAKRFASQKLVVKICLSALFGMVLFGIGLTLEAFIPTRRGVMAWPVVVSALGGIVYLLSIGFWGVLFLAGAKQK